MSSVVMEGDWQGANVLGQYAIRIHALITMQDHFSLVYVSCHHRWVESSGLGLR